MPFEPFWAHLVNRGDVWSLGFINRGQLSHRCQPRVFASLQALPSDLTTRKHPRAERFGNAPSSAQPTLWLFQLLDRLFPQRVEVMA
jgi:hypothetical protein